MKNQIDIIMGIYNCGKYLEESIDSILNQTFKDWRLIMCDDGSIDNTYNIAKKYADKYKDKIVLLKNDRNMGLNYTLNKCIEIVTAKYIARMDGDDICPRDRLQKEYDFLESHNDYCLVSCNSKLFDENGFWGELKLEEKPNKMNFINGSPFCHASVLIKTDAIREVGCYTVCDRLLRVEDYHLWFKIYEKGYKGYNLQDYLYYIRDNRETVARRNWKNRLNEVYVKKIGYKMLNIPLPYRLFKYRSIIVGLLPKNFYTFLHHIKMKGNIK